ncbi:MAG: FadR family transcriptional regulator, partial [Anaerolineae bacterium]|nr:FadR family transcriptional regulator [Anaerolineae bacterium]
MSKKKIFSKVMKKQTLAEQMAEAVEASILAGELESGAVLPTEPELAQQFGVSRAVVRDATRILMARGLVDVQHGRGVFVTPPQNEFFGAALLLALRRVGATAWDVEQFAQFLFPEIVALAAVNVSDAEIAKIRQLNEAYITVFTEHQTNWWHKDASAEACEKFSAASRELMVAIFDATHNRLIQQLARPILKLRNLRSWADVEDDTPEDMIDLEAGRFRRLVDAIASRDSDKARTSAAFLVYLPPEAVTAMQQTPVGEITEIPVPLPR